MPRHFEMVWNAKKRSHETLISIALLEILQVRNCSISHGNASLTICGSGFFPPTPSIFGRMLDVDPRKITSICIDDPGIASQTWPSVVIVRLCDIAPCSKFDHLWWVVLSRAPTMLGHFVDVSDVCGYPKHYGNIWLDGRDIASQTRRNYPILKFFESLTVTGRVSF